MTTTVNLGTPTGTYILVERTPRETHTEAGIELPKDIQGPNKVGTVLAIGTKVESEYGGSITVGGRIQWLYDLPADAVIPHEGDEEIVIIDASDVALILEPN